MPDTQLTSDSFDFEKLFTVPNAEPLPDDGPADDRSDAGMMAREQSYRQAGDLNWLLDGAESPEDEPGAEGATDPAEDPTGGLPGIAGAVASDMGMGAVEAPKQIVGGMRDATESIIDLGDILDRYMPLGGAQLFDKKTGAFDPRYFTPAEYAAQKKAGTAGENMLPEIGEGSTVTGSAIRSVSQFLAPFGVAGRMIKGVGGASKVAAGGRVLTAGAMADFAAFQGSDARLSNLIQEFPALQNPVTEYLAAEGDDSEIEGRLKNSVEGLGLGVAATALFKGLKTYKRLRTAGKAAPDRIATAFRLADEERFLREAGEMSLIGRATDDAPLTLKADKALAETDTSHVPGDVAARSLTAKALTPLNEAGDIFVNFARIDTPEDIQKIIKDTSSAFSETITEGQRGVRTNKQTLLSAEDENAWQLIMQRRTGQPLNAEQSVAARQLWATAGTKLGEVANLAAATPTPENLFQFRRMLATFHAIQKEVIGARTETARALQSWRIPVGGNLEKMRDMTQALEQGGGIEESADLARRFAQLSRMEDGGIAGMASLADKTSYQKALGTVQEYWINALLSGPKTHVVNMASNASVAALSALERGAASRYGRLFSDEAGVEIGEGLAMADGVRGGIVDAFLNAGKALRTGQSGFGIGKLEMGRQRYISSGTWNARSDSWLGRGVDGLGSVVNIPGRMLQAEDEFFKTIGYRMEVHAQATRMVQRELREGKIDFADVKARRAEIIANPPEAIRMDAVANAAYQTFTSDPGPLTRGIQKVIANRPELKFVLPFVNTPSNILKYTFERTPLAPITSKYRAAIAKGGADADLARTKMGLGTMALLYAIDLGMQGHTTGSGPSENGAEQQGWRRQGNQPYSVRIGDKSIAYNRLDPLGYTLGIGADLAEYIQNAEASDETPAEVEEGMSAALFAIVENVNSKSYLEGLSMFAEALNEPERFGPAYIERFASSFVPAIVGETARAMDPTMRASNDIVTGLKRKLPGFTEDLPARRDLWGREIRYESGLGRAYDVFSPLYGTQYKPEPIDKLMAKDGWYVGMGGSDFTINGERVTLKERPDIKARFYELRGGTKPSVMETEKADVLLDKYGDATLLETLNGLVTGDSDLAPDFQELESPEQREDYVKDIVRDYYNAAKERILLEFPELEQLSARKKALRNQGAEIGVQ